MKKLLQSPYCYAFFTSILVCQASMAQVQVREEPRHRPVFQNKYIRLLDVWIPPGDTTLYHIHSTPSVFVILSGAVTGWQIKGSEWKTEQSLAGTTWFRSFYQDTLIHRVANFDSVPFHVNDVEILAAYNHDQAAVYKPLPFTAMYENNQAAAYRLNKPVGKEQVIRQRGPMLAALVKGNEIIYHDAVTNKSNVIKKGAYLYIEPGAEYYFTSTSTGEINLLLFEFK